MPLDMNSFTFMKGIPSFISQMTSPDLYTELAP